MCPMERLVTQMHKVRSYQLLIIAVALVILSGFFPRSVTNLIDSINTQKVIYAELHTANPELTEAESAATMSVVEKLSILSHSNSIKVESDASLNLSSNEAVSLAKSNFVQYENCGLINEIPRIVSYVQPSLEIDNYDREKYCIVWAIGLIGPNNTGLDILLDDETGQILCMYYHSSIWNYSESIDVSYNKLEELSKVYFDSLEITNPTQQNRISNTDLTYKVDTGNGDVLTISFSQYPYGYEGKYGFSIDLI